MIQRVRGWFTNIQHIYDNPLEHQRAANLTSMLLLLLGAWVVSGAVFIIPQLLSTESLLTEIFLSYLSAPVLLFAIHSFIQNGRLRLASYCFVGMLFLSIILPISSNFTSAAVLLFALPLVAAGSLLNSRELSVFTLLNIMLAFVLAYNYTRSVTTETVLLTDDAIGRFLLITLTLSISSVFLWLFNGGSEHVIRRSIQALRRFENLNEFSVMAAKSRDENGLLIAIYDVLTERMRYNHVQAHLFDSGGKLFTHVRTGMGTRFSVLPTELHKQDNSAIKVALDTRGYVVIGPTDRPERRIHLLPSVTAGIIIPMIHDGRLLGFLDVQSGRSVQQFSENERILLQLMTQELMSRLITLREIQTIRQAMAERDIAYSRLEQQLTRAREELEQSAGSDWRSYITGRGLEAFGFDMLRRDGVELTPASDLPAALRPALERGEMIVEQNEREQIVMVPIIFRQEILGGMTFSVPLDRVITDRQREMAQVVAQRLAIALENARLVEQSRAQAERERTVSEISSILIGQQDIDLLLNAAAEMFNEAVGAIYTEIYLQPEAQPVAKEEAR